MSDIINQPTHYTASAIEPIDVIEAWELGFCLGNTVKYIARHQHKGTPLTDPKKAQVPMLDAQKLAAELHATQRRHEEECLSTAATLHKKRRKPSQIQCNLQKSPEKKGDIS